MSIEDIKMLSLALTNEIRRAEEKGDHQEVMRLLKEKQPIASMLYMHGLAKDANHAEAV